MRLEGNRCPCVGEEFSRQRPRGAVLGCVGEETGTVKNT